MDGVLVRSVENTHWHQPLYLIFDSETMPEWFGMPDDKDLPSTFSVEYVRAWKKAADEPKTVSNEAILTFPKIDRHPEAWDERDFWLHGLLNSIMPRQTGNPFGSHRPSDGFVTTLLGGDDLSGRELKRSFEDLLDSSFDTETIWPPAERMPKLYYPQKILDLGGNPCLGVRRLHASGTTGQGVGVALIDQPLLADHQEYKDRLKLYEEIAVSGRVVDKSAWAGRCLPGRRENDRNCAAGRPLLYRDAGRNLESRSGPFVRIFGTSLRASDEF